MSVKRIPVIIDTDPGVDDIIAMQLAGDHISGTRNLGIHYWLCLNIIKAYQAIHLHLKHCPSDGDRFTNFGRGKKPILACGASGPLNGGTHYAEEFHGSDGLGDISQRHPDLTPDAAFDVSQYLELSTKPGPDVAIDILRSYPSRSITYIALGPLTNLALMMRKESQLIIEHIGRVISMGGALDVPGNIRPMAEFNYFADPYAVKELLITSQLHKGLPRERFIMLPLDITSPHELPFPVYREIVDPTFIDTSKPSRASDKTPLVHFTSSFLERTREIMLEFSKDAVELHDIVAVWCAIDYPPFQDNEAMSGWKSHTRIFDIERTGELTRGMLVVDRREDDSAYPLGATRSEAQRDPHEGHINLDKPDKIDGLVQGTQGVVCVYETPGPAELLKLLLRRIWGCPR